MFQLLEILGYFKLPPLTIANMLSSHMAFKAYFLRSIGEKGSCDVV
jgi:hypothetical protein